MLKLIDVLENIKGKIGGDYEYMTRSKKKVENFTRNRKLGFKDIIFLMMSSLKRTLQIEIDEFIKIVKGTDFSYAKQSFSEARQKILPSAFVELNNDIIKNYYKDGDYKKYKGYRILAIDGSVFEIPNTEKLREEYGFIENQTRKTARAQASGLVDVLNKMVIEASINKYVESEKYLAIEHIEELKKIGLQNELIIFDRGYPSIELILYLEKYNIHYLMRVKSNFLTEVTETINEDEIINVKVHTNRAKKASLKYLTLEEIENRVFKVRVIKITLENGVEETLITNVLNKEDFSTEDFKEIYNLRWKIEIKYDDLKNKFQIENFSGETKIAIEQDFHCTIFLNNIAEWMKSELNEENKREEKIRKYDYSVNMNILIGKLKYNLISIMIETDRIKREKMFTKLTMEIRKNIVPIRNNRKVNREKHRSSNKYPLNKRRCL